MEEETNEKGTNKNLAAVSFRGPDSSPKGKGKTASTCAVFVSG